MIEQLLSNPFILLAITFWDLSWRGWALWIAANKKDKFWFILLLVLNTVGIVPILYIFFISKMKIAKKRKR
ncbi:MAG: hypothetical protein KJ697_02855 [Nanoarchaeota archaeon]|nr:hypothetical protein [Nanoarchaeota archaeon]MBU4124106.1 hypothetical protein [Nanoarchaeota archaeon]